MKNHTQVQVNKDLDVSKRMLNTSLPWYLHTASIKPLLLRCPMVSLF